VRKSRESEVKTSRKDLIIDSVLSDLVADIIS
jgi:hypothetical protein